MGRQQTVETRIKISNALTKRYGTPQRLPGKKVCWLELDAYQQLRWKRIRNIWYQMRYRCFNPNHGDYRYYGAKGIEVCKSWLVLENFFHDMHETWFPGATIDRINSRGNYELTNCQWLTALANNIKK